MYMSKYAVGKDGQQYIWYPPLLQYMPLKKEFWVDMRPHENKETVSTSYNSPSVKCPHCEKEIIVAVTSRD